MGAIAVKSCICRMLLWNLCLILLYLYSLILQIRYIHANTECPGCYCSLYWAKSACLKDFRIQICRQTYQVLQCCIHTLYYDQMQSLSSTSVVTAHNFCQRKAKFWQEKIWTCHFSKEVHKWRTTVKQIVFISAYHTLCIPYCLNMNRALLYILCCKCYKCTSKASTSTMLWWVMLTAAEVGKLSSCTIAITDWICWLLKHFRTCPLTSWRQWTSNYTQIASYTNCFTKLIKSAKFNTQGKTNSENWQRA